MLNWFSGTLIKGSPDSMAATKLASAASFVLSASTKVYDTQSEISFSNSALMSNSTPWLRASPAGVKKKPSDASGLSS